MKACIIFYNDTPTLLKECFLSLVKYDLKIVAIDGAFKGYPHKEVESTDGCIEIAKSYADVFITAKEWRDQIEKRNHYLSFMDDGEYCLVIDADERLQGTMPDFKDDYYLLDVVCGWNNTIDKQIRLFKYKKGMEYRDKHAWIWYENKIINHPDYNKDFKYLESLKIIHKADQRSYEKRNQDGDYTRNRKEPIEPKIIAAPLPKPTIVKTATPEIWMTFMGKRYSGFDGDSSINVNYGDKIMVSNKKAKQLLSDFPKDWIMSKE